MKVRLRYGIDGLDVDLPDANVRAVLRLNRLPVIADAPRATRAALEAPIGTAPLARLAAGRRDACIIVSDLTRPVPNDTLIPPTLDALEQARIPQSRTLILVATGLHRGNTDAELRDMGLGEAIARGVRVESHVARNTADHACLGETSLGIPAHVDRRFVEADLRLLTGLVEPHLMAGYSGGRKAICPGLCAAETIMRWHGPHMLAAPEACAGNLRGNVVHAQALEIAHMAGGADLIINVTLDEDRNITGIFAGDMEIAHLAAVERADRQAKVVLDEPVDIALTTGAGRPLDLTFYQGVKGMIGAMPIVKPGGAIIIAQENAEGIGGPEFTQMMLGDMTPAEYMRRAFAGEVCCIDQWQLQELDKVLRHCEVLNYSTGIDRDTQERLHVTPVDSVEEGVERALRRHGREASIAVIPEGPYVLAEVKGSNQE